MEVPHSELGFGIMRMPRLNGEIDWEKSERLISKYMEGDFCYFDTHPAYMEGKSQEIIRRYVVQKYPRDRFMLANKMPYYIKNSFDYEVFFARELEACGVQYFDYYLLHALTENVYELHKKFGGFDFVKYKKKEGYIRNIGFSFHDKPRVLEKILQEQNYVDFIQLQINFLDWENSVICAKECYEIARKYEKPIIVMEPLKGGNLAKEIHVDKNVITGQELAEQSLAFVASLPGVSVILSGMSEIKHIENNRVTLQKAMRGGSQKLYSDYGNLCSAINSTNAIPCTHCNYCVKECKKNIAIPDILALLNECNSGKKYDFKIEPRHIKYYEGLFQNKKAGNCIKCGKCELRCPQKIKIRTYLCQAARFFERNEKMNYYSVERNAQMLLYLLKAHGIKKIVASPGTTNVCFVYSAQQDGDFEMYSAADERSAAYMACGLAAESGEPVVISCTGATASRNYMSGLTEAFYRKLPVLAVTSTQPRDRYGNMFPQFIDRSVVPKDVVKMSVYIPSIHVREDEQNAEVNLNRAILELKHHGGGPVHINLETEYQTDYSVRVLPKARVINRYTIADALPTIDKTMKIGIYVGAYDKMNSELEEHIDLFCEQYNAVVLCDQTSNYHGKYGVMASLLTYQEVSTDSYGFFELLLHIGKISGAYMRVRAKEAWRISSDGEISDPFRSLTKVFEMEDNVFFESYLMDNITKVAERASLYQKEYDRLYENIPELPFSNIWAAKTMAPLLPNDSILHLAILNSLRSWNFFNVKKGINGYSNTGGFGIDGCMSSLIGASLADPDKLYFGIIGDLAFFYDMNSLGNRSVGNNLRIMLISNGCGTEFKNYDHIAYRFGKAADDYIAAKGHYGNKSHKLVKEYAESLGFEYHSADNKDEFEKFARKFTDPKISGRSMLFEIFTDSEMESKALSLIRRINGSRNKVEENTTIQVKVPEHIKEHKKDFTYVLWGTGGCFEKNLSYVVEKCDVRYVCDNNSAKWGKEIVKGITVISPETLKKIDNVFVIIMIEKISVGMQIANQLIDLGITKFDSVFNWLKY